MDAIWTILRTSCVSYGRSEPRVSSIEDVPGRCGSCGNATQADDDYCTRCGTKLSNGSAVIPLTTLAPPDTGPAGTAPILRRRSRSLAVGLALVSAVCVTLIAVTIISRHQLADTQSELDASQAQIATLEATRRRLVNELTATRGISQRRGTLLLRADDVLDELDPLLASVDALKKDTADIQRGRTEFRDATDALIRTTITLVNYLVKTEPSSIDADYENNLIDKANRQLETLDAYASQLTQSDKAYSKDAARFDVRATTLSTAVAALKKQFKQVTR
jgi:hypothetical protein